MRFPIAAPVPFARRLMSPFRGSALASRGALAGLFGAFIAVGCLVAAPVARAQEEEMTFESVNVNGTAVISATGRITDRTPSMFLDFLRHNGARDLHAVVFLDSPGGGVIAAMEFGSLMRKIGAAAVVAKVSSGFFGGSTMTNAQCFSACVYALIGARKRVIPPESEVGIHKMFLSIEGSGDIGPYATKRERAGESGVVALLSRYTGRMGVSPALIAYAERTPSYELHILSRAEIRKWHLGVPNL